MNGAARCVIALCMAGWLGTAFAQPVLDNAARSARDAQRLADARGQHGANAQQQRAAQARRAQQRQLLQTLQQEVATAHSAQVELAFALEQSGRDLNVLHAVAKSATQQHLQRLRTGPLGASDAHAISEALALLQAPASLDALYGLWMALYAELAQSASIARFDAPVIQLDGIRQTTTLTRYGAVSLLADTHPVAPDGNNALFELPTPSPVRTPAYSSGFVTQQIYDSGFVGVLLLVCALGGAIMVLVQSARLGWIASVRNRPVRTLPDNDRYLGVIGAAALLLGLLGTVVGMIDTFRGLALYGAADSRLAAAGISHALATTWMGLCVAIPLALVQGMLRAWRRRVAQRMHHVNATPPRSLKETAARADRRDQTRAGLIRRTPPALVLGVVTTAALFVLMHRLTSQPIVAPQTPPAPVAVERIDWTVEPPPPPPARAEQVREDAPSFATASIGLPPLEPVATPSASLAMPTLEVSAQLLGAEPGGSALAGAGATWLAGSGDSGFVGSDLIPISSARPKYPRIAAREKLEGWVELIFNIDASGSVSNVRVIDAQPPGVFELAAASAMRRWLYAPLYRNGQPVTREATQMFRFRVEDIDEQYLYDRD